MENYFYSNYLMDPDPDSLGKINFDFDNSYSKTKIDNFEDSVQEDLFVIKYLALDKLSLG